MTDERHPAFTYPPEAVPDIELKDEAIIPAHIPQGTGRFSQDDLVQALEGDRDNWRRIALMKDKQLVSLLNQIAALQAELRTALGAIEAEGKEHDRS